MGLRPERFNRAGAAPYLAQNRPAGVKRDGYPRPPPQIFPLRRSELTPRLRRSSFFRSKRTPSRRSLLTRRSPLRRSTTGRAPEVAGFAGRGGCFSIPPPSLVLLPEPAANAYYHYRRNAANPPRASGCPVQRGTSYFFSRIPSVPQQSATHFFTACSSSGSRASHSAGARLSLAQSQPLSSCT